MTRTCHLAGLITATTNGLPSVQSSRSLLRSETTSWPARTATSPDEENVVYLGALAWKTVVLSGRRNGSAMSGRREAVHFIRGIAST